MQNQSSLNLPYLRSLIKSGIQAIPIDTQTQQSVLVIGDTGVGKSTIMSFLNGSKLVVKFDGIKPTLDHVEQSVIKIGHNKYSETSIPTKIVIEEMAFYDCPGFKDNKGQEYQISNSFFVQRLLDLYSKAKILLIIDQSHISQTRSDKLPKLLKNLLQAFKSFEEIQDGCCMIINRATQQNTYQDYLQQLTQMITLQHNNSNLLFDQQSQAFIKYLINNNRIILFKQANKKQTGSLFHSTTEKQSILKRIKSINYVRTHHINNIISDNAKLAIRDYVDQITLSSNRKIEEVCQVIYGIYCGELKGIDKDQLAVIRLKENVRRLADTIAQSNKTNIVNILHSEIPAEKIQDFEEDFTSILFFRDIYDHTETYFSNLVNKIYSELSTLMTMLDKTIVAIQQEKQQQKQRDRIQYERQMKQEQEKQLAILREIQEQKRRRQQEERRRKQQEERRERERQERQEARRLQAIRLQQERQLKKQLQEKQEREQKERRELQKQEREKQRQEERQRKHREVIEKYQQEKKERQDKERIEREERLAKERLERQQQQQKQRKQRQQRQQRQERLKAEERQRAEEKQRAEERLRAQEKQRAEERFRAQQKQRAQERKRAQQKQRSEERLRAQEKQRAEEKQRKQRQQRQERLRTEERQRAQEKQRAQEQYIQHQQQQRYQQQQQQQQRNQPSSSYTQQQQQQQQQQNYRTYQRPNSNTPLAKSPSEFPQTPQNQHSIQNLSQSYHSYDHTSQNNSRSSLLQQIKKAMQSLKGIQGQLKKVKLDAINLHNLNQEIGSEFVRIQQKYFSKPNKF